MVARRWGCLAAAGLCACSLRGPLPPPDGGPGETDGGSESPLDGGEECLISGVWVSAGDANPFNPCSECDPSVSSSAWTPLDDGTACDAGQICVSGTCSTACDIDGGIYASGALNPGEPCLACVPSETTSGWGSACGLGEICTDGGCFFGCAIGAEVYPAGTINPDNPCSVCDGDFGSGWGTALDGTPCDAGWGICESGACLGSCGTSDLVCPMLADCPAGLSCSAGASLRSQAVDLFECMGIAAASVIAFDANGVWGDGIGATTQSDGTFAVCLSGARAFSLEISAANYPTTFYAELSSVSAIGISQIGLLSVDVLDALAAFLPGGLNSVRALIWVSFLGSACQGDYAGWSLSLTLPDGGALPDGGGGSIIYFAPNNIPSANATATSSNGLAMIYDVDPTISDFLVLRANKSDAGSCSPINASRGFTGRVAVAAGAVTFAPILLP